jgi:hypothetical protein
MFIFILKCQERDDFVSIGLAAYAEDCLPGAELRGVQITHDEIQAYEFPTSESNTDIQAILIREHHIFDLADCHLETCLGIFVHCHEDNLSKRVGEIFSTRSDALKQQIMAKSASFSVGGNMNRLDFMEKLTDFLANPNVEVRTILHAWENLAVEHSKRRMKIQAPDWLELYLNIQLLIADHALAEKMRKSVRAKLTELLAFEGGNFTDPKGKELFVESGLGEAARTFSSALAAYPDEETKRAEFKEAAEKFLKVIREAQQAARHGESGKREGVVR